MHTPLYELGSYADNRIFIKREDLYPFLLGGNKARIAQEYLNDMKLKNADCLIGYGNARSNLNRTLALAAAASSIPFHIICPLDDDGERAATFNSRLAKLCGASLHECSKSSVSETVFQVVQDLEEKGYRPYYINGNRYGKGNEAVPVGAYVKVYHEIKEQEEELKTQFDYIFLAVGTGMTMAGLLVSQIQKNNCDQIVGVSVARGTDVAAPVVQNYCDAYCRKHGLKVVPDHNILILDDYRCGGYGKSCEEENQTIMEVLKSKAIPLDQTYTGKAFWGMNCFLREKGISGCNVLFIHTGGTPLFYDMLSPLPFS